MESGASIHRAPAAIILGDNKDRMSIPSALQSSDPSDSNPHSQLCLHPEDAVPNAVPTRRGKGTSGMTMKKLRVLTSLTLIDHVSRSPAA